MASRSTGISTNTRKEFKDVATGLFGNARGIKELKVKQAARVKEMQASGDPQFALLEQAGLPAACPAVRGDRRSGAPRRALLA